MLYMAEPSPEMATQPGGKPPKPPRKTFRAKGETVVLPEEEAWRGEPLLSDIRQDLAKFDSLFGLPAPDFRVNTSLAPGAPPYQASVEYLEDVEALQWISEVVQQDDEPQFDLNFAPDKPGLLMRRVLYRLATAEADGL